MKEINWQQNLQNYRKKDSKFNLVKQISKIEKKDLEGLQIKFKDIIDVHHKLAKDHMDLKVH
jgi:RecB family endonuclease NucS